MNVDSQTQSTSINRTRLIEINKPEHEMMDEHPSYHEQITGKEAEKRLQRCTEHGYLTRYSKINQYYVLSVCRKTVSGATLKHFRIVFKNNGHCKEYQIGEKTEKTFQSLLEMLNYYEKNRIDPALNNIGQPVTEDEYTGTVNIKKIRLRLKLNLDD